MDGFLICPITFQLSNGDTVFLEKGLEITIDVAQGIGFDGEFYFDLSPNEYALIY